MNSSIINELCAHERCVLPACERPSSLIPGFLSIPGTYHWRWYQLFYLLLLCQTASILWKFWWKAPSGVPIAAYPTPWGRCLTALSMILRSDALMKRAYDSSSGKPFAIPTLDRWIIFVSGKDELARLEQEPESVLSMEHALHELAFTGSIMAHHQVSTEQNGPKSEAFRVPTGVMKNQLRSNVPSLSGALHVRVKESVALEVGSSKDPLEPTKDGWRRIRLFPALLRILTRVNLLAFVGEDHAHNIEVYDKVMGFFASCARAFPIISLTPGLLLPIIAPLAMGWGMSRHKLYEFLLGLTRGAIQEKNNKAKHPKQGHITQWVAEMSRLREATETAKIALGLLFASAFQVPMLVQYCIFNLCRYPEYQEQLRAEALESKDVVFSTSNQEMPYLDSFVKETARLSPGPILSAPRRVMVPYTAHESYHIPAGNWIAIPQFSLMRDDRLWPRASAFEGFRFVNESDGTSESRFTHPSHQFPFWGAVRHACPARFYVSVIMKMLLSHISLDYEIKLVDPTAPSHLTFGIARLPNPFMEILVRKRTEGKSGQPEVLTL